MLFFPLTCDFCPHFCDVPVWPSEICMAFVVFTSSPFFDTTGEKRNCTFIFMSFFKKKEFTASKIHIHLLEYSPEMKLPRLKCFPQTRRSDCESTRSNYDSCSFYDSHQSTNHMMRQSKILQRIFKHTICWNDLLQTTSLHLTKLK